MDKKYGDFLNGLTKFERMLEDADKKYSKMVQRYWFLLLRQCEELGFGRKSFEHRTLMRLKARMMKVFKWPYHPRYNPRGERNEHSDALDKIWKSWRGL